VHVRVPAKLSPGQRRELQTLSRRAFAALGIRDLGRLDFRLSEDGKLYFIEANALPSLEPGAAIYESARRAGLQTPRALLGAVVSSALRRRGLKPASARASSKGLVVGLTYNLKRIKPQADGARDDEAEFDSRETIDALRAAIESHGHRVVELEATAELPLQLGGSRVDVVFNLAEGQGGRGREAQVPALLELCNIPYTGSDATALCLCLDKGLAKRVVSGAGVHTASSVEMTTGKEALPSGLSFPLLVKPLWEGSSKGVLPSSVVHDERALRKRVRAMVERYQQPALVEQYLPGREFTIALLGGPRPRVLPPMEIVFTEQAGKFPVYAIEHKLSWVEAVRYQVPATITAALARKLEQAALGAFVALGCRDVARVDLRLDADGEPCFIECNPLPGLTPAWSDLCLIATAAGIDYPTLVGQILAPAIRRFKARRPGPRRARTA
jgi:D-alanine-D-alanine ligase